MDPKKTDSDSVQLALEAVEVAQQIQALDLTVNSQGQPTKSNGVAPNRRISIVDPDMRHGRKSRSQKVDGYKRHVLKDLDLGVVRGVGVTPANVPEALVTSDLEIDLEAQNVRLVELHIDRAYLTSKWVSDRNGELKIFCKAWPVRNGELFNKTAFVLDWENNLIRCPNQVTIPFKKGKVVHFPKHECAACPLRDRCTTNAKERSVSIHPDKTLMHRTRIRQLSAQGRADLRRRTAVEHALAHVGQWQGDRARYVSLRKNLFDLRRVAVVHNLHVIARMGEPKPPRSAAR